MALPSLLTRVFGSRQIGPKALQLAQESRKEVLQRADGFFSVSVPEMRGYIRARAYPVVERNVRLFLHGEGAALASQREPLFAKTLEVATEQALLELRQGQRQAVRRWKAA